MKEYKDGYEKALIEFNKKWEKPAKWERKHYVTDVIEGSCFNLNLSEPFDGTTELYSDSKSEEDFALILFYIKCLSFSRENDSAYNIKNYYVGFSKTDNTFHLVARKRNENQITNVVYFTEAIGYKFVQMLNDELI